MDTTKYKGILRTRRAMRKRKRTVGTAERPRLSVFRSARHIYSQLIDDSARKTLLSVSSKSKGVCDGLDAKANKTDVAVAVGSALGTKVKELGIERVRFDVGPYKFHGRVKALAEAVLKSGVKF